MSNTTPCTSCNGRGYNRARCYDPECTGCLDADDVPREYLSNCEDCDGKGIWVVAPHRKLPRKVSGHVVAEKAYIKGFHDAQEMATQTELAALGLMANYYIRTRGF